MDNSEKYAAQKKYLANRKQLRVWVSADKFNAFKAAAEKNGESIYSLINNFIDEYLNA